MDRLSLSARLWSLRAAVAILLLALLGALGAMYRLRRVHSPPVSLPSLPAAFADRVPSRVLWAWDEPEDLRALPQGVGVAYLAETDRLSDHVTAQPRMQPLRIAPGAPLVAVVRIETRPGFADTPQLRSTLAEHLAAYGARHDIRALQIDFDATASQRIFYRGVLEELRNRLPRTLPLSITALVSWCGTDSWLHGLPIDEAVPMYFRMGGPRLLVTQPRAYSVAEPLCRTSLGLSTDERWPRNVATADPRVRIYIFAPAAWQPQQLTAVVDHPLPTLQQELVR